MSVLVFFSIKNLVINDLKSLVVYYESIKRELKIRCIYECRCDERLQTKTKEFTRLAYTGLVVELERLKIETRLIEAKSHVRVSKQSCKQGNRLILRGV